MHCDGCEDSDHFCDDDNAFNEGTKPYAAIWKGTTKLLCALPRALALMSPTKASPILSKARVCLSHK